MRRHSGPVRSLAAGSLVDRAMRNGRRLGGPRDTTSYGRPPRTARLAGWRSWIAEPGAVSTAAVQFGHRAPGALAVHRTETNDTIEIVVVGELDIATREIVRDALVQAGEGAPQRLVIDLSRVTFIDVSGLHLVLAAAEYCRARGAPALRLVPGPPQVHEVFEITRLAHRLPFVASPSEPVSICTVQDHEAHAGRSAVSHSDGVQPSQSRRIDADISASNQHQSGIITG